MTDAIARALAMTPVVVAWLMGSRARGTARDDSDTDVGVVLPRGVCATLDLVAGLTVRLRDAGVPEPDVHVLAETPLAFQAEAVLHGERAFCADEEVRVSYETYVTTRYLDFEPLLRAQYAIQRRRLREEGTLGPARRR